MASVAFVRFMGSLLFVVGPFDVAAFRAEYKDLEKGSAAPSLIRSAATQRDLHIRKLVETGALPANFDTTFVDDVLRFRNGGIPRVRADQLADPLRPPAPTFDQRVGSSSAR